MTINGFVIWLLDAYVVSNSKLHCSGDCLIRVYINNVDLKINNTPLHFSC